MKKKIFIAGMFFLVLLCGIGIYIFSQPKLINKQLKVKEFCESFGSCVPKGRCSVIPILGSHVHCPLSMPSNCPSDKPFRGECGECAGCNYYGVLTGHQEDFEICPNRKWFSRENGYAYSALRCPDSTPLWDLMDQYCKTCSFEGPVHTDKESCDQCPNRRFEDGWCIDKLCPELIFKDSQEIIPE